MPKIKTPLTIMIEPKFRWYVELLARKWRCSMSEALCKTLKRTLAKESDIQLLADQTWSTDVDEQIKLIKKHAPDLITSSEELWLKREKDHENQ